MFRKFLTRRSAVLNILGVALAVICAAGLLAPAAHAAPMTFFGEDNAGGSLPVPNSAAAQAAFLSNLVGVGVEDFEGFAANTALSGGGIVANFGADTATLTSNIGPLGAAFIRSGTAFGTFPISGTQHVDNNFTQLTLSFSSPQAAFGFFGTDIGDVSGQLTLTFDGGAPVVVPHTVNGPNGTGLFFGFIDVSNPFSQVVFTGSSADDRFGFDDFTIGRQEQVVDPGDPRIIPEPTSLTLLGLGAMGLLGCRCRRRRDSQPVA